jgi:hypothetical protein
MTPLDGQSTDDLLNALVRGAVADGMEPPHEAAETLDGPVVRSDVLRSRVASYRAAGVPPRRAVELALDDALATVEMAEDLDQSGVVGGLISRSNHADESAGTPEKNG